MIIFPAIDLRGGKVVRLVEGDPNRQTVFSHNPVDTAKRWSDEGADWVHVVNLDGALDKANDNAHIVRALAKRAMSSDVNVKIQFGGGLRSIDDIQRALDLGASRVVLGTLAIKEPDVVQAAIEQFGAEHIAVALDSRDGKVTTHGWTEVSDQTPLSLGQAMVKRGVRYALYTDVSRDGSLQGSNVVGTVQLSRQTGLNVIASGGVTKMSEIRQLAQQGVYGVVIGMALYRGSISMQEALFAAQQQEDSQQDNNRQDNNRQDNNRQDNNRQDNNGA